MASGLSGMEDRKMVMDSLYVFGMDITDWFKGYYSLICSGFQNLNVRCIDKTESTR